MDHIELFRQRNGLPESVAAAWRARAIDEWTPLQQAAWREGVQSGAVHWLVAGPTSAGKTMVAEAAAACALTQGRKVLWLAPTRALALQVSRQMEATLAGLGLRVRCATHDTAAEDAQIFRNQFDLLVAVYEKAAAWTARQPHGLAEVGLVVADELTMLRDPERGGRLDALLTLLQSSPYAPRRLGLTLPVPNLEELARWWGGRLLLCRERPRPLHEGALDLGAGALRWRDRDTGEEGEERLEDPKRLERWIARASRALDDPDWPPLRTATAAVAAGLAARGEPTLLFAPSRIQARLWAEGVAEAFNLTPPPKALREESRALADREPTYDHQLLARTLERGVGVHHADLSPEARRIIEEAFRSGAIRLLVATPTLAQGVNLAAVNVLHWPERPDGSAAGGVRSVALERWRFADQGGRAGRLGLGEGAGRSILVAWDARHADALWSRYILQPAEPIVSGLAQGPLAPALINCLAGDVARTRGNLKAFFMGTLAGATAWRERPEALEAKLEEALELCRGAELIKDAGPGGGLRLTGLGQTCAAQGIEPETAARLRPWLAEEAGLDLDGEPPLGALCALALSAPAGLWPAQARPGRTPVVGELCGWFEEQGRELPGPLAELVEQPGGPGVSELAALEAAWRMSLWTGAEPTEQVERRTGWTAGALGRAGEGLAWVAGGAAALTLALGGRMEAAQRWRELGARLGAGATREGAALAALRIEGLGRGALQALCAAGLATARAVAESPMNQLLAVLGDKALARRVRAAARQAARAVRSLRLDGANTLWSGGTGGGRFQIPDLKFEIEEIGDGGRSGGAEAEAEVIQKMGAIAEMEGGEPVDEAGDRREERDGPPAEEPLIALDLQSPGVVRIAGREVRLTPLTFDLLAALAEQPGRVLTRQAIYQRLWPEGGPEDQQLDAHRRRLAGELSAALGGAGGAGGSGRGVIETIRGVGFRLNVPERSVQLQRG